MPLRSPKSRASLIQPTADLTLSPLLRRPKARDTHRRHHIVLVVLALDPNIITIFNLRLLLRLLLRPLPRQILKPLHPPSLPLPRLLLPSTLQPLLQRRSRRALLLLQPLPNLIDPPPNVLSTRLPDLARLADAAQVLHAVDVLDPLQVVLEREVARGAVEARAAPALPLPRARGHEGGLADVGGEVEHVAPRVRVRLVARQRLVVLLARHLGLVARLGLLALRTLARAGLLGVFFEVVRAPERRVRCRRAVRGALVGHLGGMGGGRTRTRTRIRC